MHKNCYECRGMTDRNRYMIKNPLKWEPLLLRLFMWHCIKDTNNATKSKALNAQKHLIASGFLNIKKNEFSILHKRTLWTTWIYLNEVLLTLWYFLLSVSSFNNVITNIKQTNFTKFQHLLKNFLYFFLSTKCYFYILWLMKRIYQY